MHARLGLILFALTFGGPLAGLHAEEISIAKFDEKGSLLGLSSGKGWTDLGAQVVLPTKGWKNTLKLGSSVKEGEADGKRTWRGIAKGAEGSGFDILQTVWQEDGRLAIEVAVKSLGSDTVDGAYYSCTLPIKSFAGWRYRSGQVEGEFPRTYKSRRLLEQEEKTTQLELKDSTGETSLTFAFPEGAIVRIDDGRSWERTYYWLAVNFHRGPLPQGQTARLRMTVSTGRGNASEATTAAAPAAAPSANPQDVPDEKLQKEAEELIRDFFKDGFAKTDPAGRAALAKKLMREAQLTNTDMDLKFVLLREARVAALDGGHLELALTALDATGAAFVFDAAKEKAALLTQLARSAKTPEAAQNVAEACLKMAEELIGKEQYGEAGPLVAQAETAAKNVKDAAWQKETGRRIKEAQDILREYGRVADAFKKLEAAPEDPAANTAAGRFQCLVRGKWEAGLPRLVKGSDAALKKLAQTELAGPADATAQAQLGEDWWQYSKSLSGKACSLAQEHAVQWLQKAQPNLDAARQEQIAKILIAFYTSAAEQGLTGGAFQAGNVALTKNGAKLFRVGEGGALTPEHHLAMLDGVTTGYTGSTGFTYRSYPCAWVLTFPKTYLLQEIRMLIWDGEEQRFYRYIIETSQDGKDYQLVADCSKGEWRSWQAHRFPPRLVKYIRLKGLHNSVNSGFHVVELEAYCIPPATPVKPLYPSNPGAETRDERKPDRHRHD